MDVPQFIERGWAFSHMAPALSEWPARTDHFRTDGGRRICHVSGRPFLRHLRGIKAKRGLGARCKRRAADFTGRLQLRSKIYSRWKAFVLPDSEGCSHCLRPGRTAPSRTRYGTQRTLA